jgi:predicted ferric reductase
MDTNQLFPKNDDLLPTVPWQTFLIVLLASAGGALAAVLVLPDWLPGLGASMTGNAPHAYWFLSRASALVAYWLLWLAMCLGLIITNKLARLWPGGPVAFDLHQHTSLLGLAFATFHGLILLGDHYLGATFWQAVLPFSMQQYRPLWVGLGQLSFFLLVPVTFSFYVRKQITPRKWRLIHFLSFISYAFALLHGIASGTDSTTMGVQAMYWITGSIFLFLFIYRVLITLAKPAHSGVRILSSVQTRRD